MKEWIDNHLTVGRLPCLIALAALIITLSGFDYSSAEVAAPEAGTMCEAAAGDEQEHHGGARPAQTWLGGDVAPVRSVLDPHPSFVGVAVDPDNDLALLGDTNGKSLLIYDRTVGKRQSPELTEPLRQISGPATNLGFVAGVLLDARHREILSVNNDIEDTMMVMSYDDRGNVKPKRLLSVPHQAWGLALSPSRDELAVSVEIQNGIAFYRRTANGVEAPLRVIKGQHTGMADPHGLAWDDEHHEIAVANHGNFRGLMKNTGLGCVPATPAEAAKAKSVSAPTASATPDCPPEKENAQDNAPALSVTEGEGGKFQPPSITVYDAAAKDDAKPRRAIQGQRTHLDWPMGIAVDPAHDEIAVANNGDDSVLIFRRTASGDVAPVRAIRGAQTGINRPMGVAVDLKHDELWVANFGDHTAVVFPRAAQGNVPPKRIIRSAPDGAPTVGFGNPMAVAYDSKRREILVPN